jgi:hypothetical protein
MMILVDYFNVLTGGSFLSKLKKYPLSQHFVACFLGTTPGCLGTFVNVSCYTHGFFSFGAMFGGMVATVGESAFVMLSLFPQKALFLFFLLFTTGLISGVVIDQLLSILKIKSLPKCKISSWHHHQECRIFKLSEMITHLRKPSSTRLLLLFLIFLSLYGIIFFPGEKGEEGSKKVFFLFLLVIAGVIVFSAGDHYLKEHIWQHLLKKHLWKIFFWCFGTLLIIEIGLNYLDLTNFIKNHLMVVLFLAVLLGLIPDSCPQLVFVFLFAKGIIPFSALLVNSLVQDGHGVLPLFSYSIKSVFLMKLLKLTIGVGVALVFWLLGR